MRLLAAGDPRRSLSEAGHGASYTLARMEVALPFVSLLIVSLAATSCMTTLGARRAHADIAELRARVDARRDTDRHVEQAIADLTRAFEDVQARWVSSGGGTDLAATRMEKEIATLQARTNELADELQRQARARADARAALEKRVATLEQADAQLAEKVGLFIPDDKEELWRQTAALLASGHRDQGRRYSQVFIDRFPQDSRASRAYLAIGRSYADEARYSSAVATYQQLLALYPAAPEAPEAMWQLSRAFSALSFCSDARALLRNLVDRYPTSPEAANASKQLRSSKRGPKVAECVS